MPDSILPPLPPDSLVYTPGSPEFIDLTLNTLGDVGTGLDGFDPVFDAVAQDHASLPGLLSAIRHCFEKAHSPFSDLGVNTESLVDSAQADAFTSIKAANDSYDSLFVAAPPPPVVPGASPPSRPGPSGGPPVTATHPKACPPGQVPEAGDPAFCIPATAVGPITGPSTRPTGALPGVPPAGGAGEPPGFRPR